MPQVQEMSARMLQPCRRAKFQFIATPTRIAATGRWYSSMKARFSSGSDEGALAPRLESLLTEKGGHWSLTKEGEALERSFKFKTFAKTWDFMTAVSLQCKVRNHHPEWSNVYNTTFIRWTTHDPKGLSEKDISMATACDAIAKDFGGTNPGPTACELRDMADKATTSAGDCCSPRKAS